MDDEPQGRSQPFGDDVVLAATVGGFVALVIAVLLFRFSMTVHCDDASAGPLAIFGLAAGSGGITITVIGLVTPPRFRSGSLVVSLCGVCLMFCAVAAVAASIQGGYGCD